jgi:hypothetical protein
LPEHTSTRVLAVKAVYRKMDGQSSAQSTVAMAIPAWVHRARPPCLEASPGPRGNVTAYRRAVRLESQTSA